MTRTQGKARKAGAGWTFFRNIGELLSLSGVAAKQGRCIVEADLGLVKRSVLLTRSGRIIYCGIEKGIPTDLRPQLRTAREVDLEGRCVVPAFLECHTHSVFAGHRAEEFEMKLRGVSYQEIARQGGGILSTVSKVRKAPFGELVDATESLLESFLRQGVTLTEIKSGYGLDVPSELKMLKVIDQLKTTRVISTFLGAHALPKDASGRQLKSEPQYLEELVRSALPRILKETSCRRVDIFIENGFFSPPAARDYLTAFKSAGFDLTIHADQLSRSGGVDLAVELGAKSADHAICLNENDLSRLAESEVTAVLLPSADLYMKCPYPPARKLLDQGGRVALATDFNPGTSPSQDLALVGLLARREMGMTLPEVISAYTWNAACALGKEKELGSLGPGKFADFVTLEGDWTELFYKVGNMGVHSVFMNGKKRFSLAN